MRAYIMKHFILFAAVACSAAAQSNPTSQPITNQPKHSQDWFKRASESMALRLPGSKPFHLTIKFHAFAGEELLGPNETTDFITGDGTYDEVWIEPHRWRREVALAGYHAVEVEADGVRKMNASSDYEPSRVLMLLHYLSTPVAVDLTNGSLRATSWKIDDVSAGALSLVRLSKVMAATQRTVVTDTYYFLPQGELSMSNVGGVVAAWSNDVAFAGKRVPRKLMVKCGDRDLLTADISIDPAEQVGPTTFDLPGGPAEPGMTLQELHEPEAKLPDTVSRMNPLAGGLPYPNSGLILRGVLDRTGVYREVEVLLGQESTNAAGILSALRTLRGGPAKVGHSPCEFVRYWTFL
jgi:hypothetical protein